MPPVPPTTPDPDGPRLLTIPQAAQILGVHRATLYRMAYRTNPIPTLLVGGRLHVTRAWVQTQIAQQGDTHTTRISR